MGKTKKSPDNNHSYIYQSRIGGWVFDYKGYKSYFELFLNYLLRLKELRNRCAHNGRIFNRNFRGLKAFGTHTAFRKTIYEHKILDVYYSLHVLIGSADGFKTVDDLINLFVSNNLVGLESKLEDFVLGFTRTR